ncbi:MAG: hypothetical protein IKR09_07125, partial [Alphaproteobacteria bacterium]|nr:hypothetical protein [Alphaproteobacteria bacterium]
MKQKNAYSGLSLFICFVLVTLSLKSEAYAWPCSSQSDVTNKTSSYLCDDLHPYPCEDTTVGNCQYPSSNYSDTDNYWFSTKTKSVNISGINHTVFYAICKGYRETGAPSPNVATFAPYIAGANRTICSAKCPTGCSSCSIKNKKEGLLKCGGCSSGYTKQGDLCCHSGYYVPTHNASNSCTKCPDNYKTCSGNSFTCKAGFYKNGNTCKACPAGTYSADGNTAASCTACPTECSACTSASVCTACSDGYGLIDHSCVKTETYTIEFYDKSGKFHTESKTGTPKNVSVYTGYLYGNIDKHYYSCATDKENKKVICSCSGAGSSWHGYFKDKSRCEAWINSQSGFCDVIDGYSSSHPNCQYVAKYCSRGCKKCTSSSNCTECSSGFRLENSYCKEVKEYSIKFTDKKGSVGKDST